MGCINSKKELRELQLSANSESNVYRAYACRISTESGTMQSGYLELSPKELVFSPEMGDTIKWALQHLRRYGCTDDVFSFEAGRRCMTGPGIYTFRCHNAENMHQLFKSYINTVARSDETVPMLCTDLSTSLDLGSNPHNYLEPNSADSILYNRAPFHDSGQSSPLSSNLNSPSSLQGAHFTNEVVHFNSQPNKHGYPHSNVYQEFPMKSNEFNNNIPNKTKSHDVPPQETAPNVHKTEVENIQHRKYACMSDEQHMYENVNSLEKSASSDRCYENFSSIDLPLLATERIKSTMNEETLINYITLDLVQSPTSTDSFSLKVKSNSADVSTASGNKSGEIIENINTVKGQDFSGRIHLYASESNSNPVTILSNNQSSSMGYSTIDFIKTCALIKSVPSCNVDCQEFRLTRHSTCILKNSSLSD